MPEQHGDPRGTGTVGDKPSAGNGSASPDTGSGGAPRLNPEALHGLAGDIVKEIEPHTEASSAALLLTTLAYFGACIGSKAHAWVEASPHPARIFPIIVGETSAGRKGTSERQIRHVFKTGFGEQLVPIVSGLSSGEGLIHHVRDPLNEDAGVDDKRLLVSEGEFSRVLTAAGREGSTLSDVLRNAWDSGDLRTLTKKSPDVATGAHICIVAHITRDELLAKLRHTDSVNGFANRFLWVHSNRSKLLPHGGAFPDAGYEDLGSQIRSQAKLIQSRGEMRFDRDPGAKALWEAVYPQLTEARAGLFGSVTSRAEAQTFRLSLIYALLDYKPGDDLLIREPHVAAALAAWWYCEGSAQIIFGDSTGDERADVALECLQNSEAGVLSRTEVGLAVFGKHSTKPKLDAVRNLLERHDRISVEMCPTSGRPVEMWFLRARMLGGA